MCTKAPRTSPVQFPMPHRKRLFNKATRRVGKHTTVASKTTPTANSGLQVEAASTSSSEVASVEEVRVNTRANVVDRFLINPNRTAKPPPHKRDLYLFQHELAFSHRGTAYISFVDFPPLAMLLRLAFVICFFISTFTICLMRHAET